MVAIKTQSRHGLAVALLLISSLSQSMAFRALHSDSDVSKEEAAELFVPASRPIVGGVKRSDVAEPQVGTLGVGGNVKVHGAQAHKGFRQALKTLRMSEVNTDGESSMQDLATAAMDSGGDPAQIANAMENLNAEDKKAVETVKMSVLEKAKNMPGVSGPMGFFDPLGFCTDCSEGRLCFYREVEVKHGRVAMLASLGFLIGEQFHPLFNGNIVPSYVAFQETPLQTFWPAVVAAIAIPESFSVFTFQLPWKPSEDGLSKTAFWQVKTDREGGDLNFDPLGLKPKDPESLKYAQTQELNNGRLAMIAAAGMVAQELATGQKLFQYVDGLKTGFVSY